MQISAELRSLSTRLPRFVRRSENAKIKLPWRPQVPVQRELLRTGYSTPRTPLEHENYKSPNFRRSTFGCIDAACSDHCSHLWQWLMLPTKNALWPFWRLPALPLAFFRLRRTRPRSPPPHHSATAAPSPVRLFFDMWHIKLPNLRGLPF